jgi:hypothetical protein
MDRPDVSPVSRPTTPAGARVDDVAPLSVVRPGQAFMRPSSFPIATSFARVRTQHAIQYLHGLNRHWHRHVPVFAHTDAHAEIAFPIGRCELDAGADCLDIRLTAGSTYDAASLEDLVSESLDRLAWREDVQYQWIRPAPAAAHDPHANRSRTDLSWFHPTEGVVPRHGRTP